MSPTIYDISGLRGQGSAREPLFRPLDSRHMYDLDDGYSCKYCGTHTAFRSHRKNFIEFLRTRLTGMVPFRCYRCQRRFWALIDARDI